MSTALGPKISYANHAKQQPGKKIKQEEEETSRNHVKTFSGCSVLGSTKDAGWENVAIIKRATECKWNIVTEYEPQKSHNLVPYHFGVSSRSALHIPPHRIALSCAVTWPLARALRHSIEGNVTE